MTEIIKGYIVTESKQLSAHFKASEFNCHCCGKLHPDGMNKHLIELLEEIRVKINKPITIMSGYRCPKHNKEVGGAEHSQHVEGTAADIKVKGMDADDVQHWLVLNFNDKIGGIGCYKTFTHIDVRSGHARWSK
jgi:uncharacterized protein YcbK (DUF882 family)